MDVLTLAFRYLRTRPMACFAGLFLAVPITVILMIICAHFDPTRWVAVLLSSDGEIVHLIEQDKR